MPLPLIPVAIAIGASVVAGGGLAAKGGTKMVRAKRICKTAQERHGVALSGFRDVEATTQERARLYGELQIQVQAETLRAWVEWLEANEKKVRRLESETVDGVPVEVPDVPTLKSEVIEAVSVAKGGVTAAASVATAYQAALWGVGSFAAAGTGASISGLSGAAASNATLAWLGGGTLAAGGGGMALGAVMLTGIAVAPAALIGGFVLAAEGEKALTKAYAIDAKVDVAVAELAAKGEVLGEVQTRIGEMRAVLTDLDQRARLRLEALRGVDFDPQRHAELFQSVALLMASVREVLNTPIVDQDGVPTAQSAAVKETFTS